MDLTFYQKRRKELNLTYDKLTEISGVSKRMIAGFFGGDPKYANPSMATLQAIERALGLDNTTTDEERAAGAVDSAKISVNADQMAWLEIYDEILKKRGKNTAAAFIEAFRNMLDL